MRRRSWPSTVMYPSRARSRSAPRIGVRLNPSRLASWVSTRRAPGGKRPETISSRSCAYAAATRCLDTMALGKVFCIQMPRRKDTAWPGRSARKTQMFTRGGRSRGRDGVGAGRSERPGGRSAAVHLQLPRQTQDERAAAAELALEGDVAAEQPGELETHAEAEAGAALGAGHPLLELLEGVEDALAVLQRDPGARVRDAELDGLAPVAQPQVDSASLGGLDGVRGEIEEDLADLAAVGVHDDGRVRQLELEAETFAAGERPDHGGDVAEELRGVDPARVHAFAAGLDA